MAKPDKQSGNPTCLAPCRQSAGTLPSRKRRSNPPRGKATPAGGRLRYCAGVIRMVSPNSSGLRARKGRGSANSRCRDGKTDQHDGLRQSRGSFLTFHRSSPMSPAKHGTVRGGVRESQHGLKRSGGGERAELVFRMSSQHQRGSCGAGQHRGGLRGCGGIVAWTGLMSSGGSFNRD